MAEMTILEQAKSILGVIHATYKDKTLLASEELAARRVAICKGCEKLKEGKGKIHCVVCGCGFKQKVAFHGSSCPLKKW